LVCDWEVEQAEYHIWIEGDECFGKLMDGGSILCVIVIELGDYYS
jgi:hypothetical protein